MKTKPFLLATAGSTVDGRTIDDAMLQQIASSYDPKTYGARLNIEHIRGVTGEPFRAYGDVVELSIGKSEVNFNGKKERAPRSMACSTSPKTPRSSTKPGRRSIPRSRSSRTLRARALPISWAAPSPTAPRRSPPSAWNSTVRCPARSPWRRNARGAGIPDDPEANGPGLIAAFTARWIASPPSSRPRPRRTLRPGRSRPARRDGLRPAAPAVRRTGHRLRQGHRGSAQRIPRGYRCLAVKLQKLEATQEKTPAHDYRARTRSDGGAANYAGVF
jgi:hypothetical protein